MIKKNDMLLRIFICLLNTTTTLEYHTLSLHDALPIFDSSGTTSRVNLSVRLITTRDDLRPMRSSVSNLWRSSMPDRKSTRLNSSHVAISYAVFCLKKKKKLFISIYNRIRKLS